MKRSHADRNFSQIAPKGEINPTKNESQNYVPMKFVKSAEGEPVATSAISNSGNQEGEEHSTIPSGGNIDTTECVVSKDVNAGESNDVTEQKQGLPPMMLLNQQFPGITDQMKFETTESTIDGMKRPYFICRVELMGREFVGEGLTKKEAKQKMAKTAIEAFPPSESTDKKQKKAAKKTPESQIERLLARARAAAKSPVQVLRELILVKKLPLKVTVEYKDVTNGNGDLKPQDMRFVCIVALVRKEVGEQSGGEESGEKPGEESGEKPGEGRFVSAEFVSKKLALKDAAKQTLRDLFQIDTKMFDEIDASRFEAGIQNKNMVQAMYELCMSKGHQVKEESKASLEDRSFTTVYKIGDKSFTGESQVSKRDAKRIAAIHLMREMFGIDISNEPAASNAPQSAPTQPPVPPVGDTPGTTNRQLLPPIDVLNRISDLTGTPIFHETVSTSPQFSIKTVIGKASVVGHGNTQYDAKCSGAAMILTQMGITGYPTKPRMEGLASGETTGCTDFVGYGHNTAQYGEQYEGGFDEDEWYGKEGDGTDFGEPCTYQPMHTPGAYTTGGRYRHNFARPSGKRF